MLFMRQNSAIIELFTSFWYENGYQATALMYNLHYQVIALESANTKAMSDYNSFDDVVASKEYQEDLTKINACSFPVECYFMDLFIERRSIDCFGLRNCNAQRINPFVFEVFIWQASQYVRIKRGIYTTFIIELSVRAIKVD